MKSLSELLAESAALHRHLCPRQVIGARMGLWAGELLGLALPQNDKRLLTIVECDGCFADGIAVATNCWVGRRTLRVEDYGKVAATFVDSKSERAFRIAPHPQARTVARDYAPGAHNRWEAMLLGYQQMPTQVLLVMQPVQLLIPVAELISKAGRRIHCDHCGEEVVNERQIMRGGRSLCRACAGPVYYKTIVN